MFKELNLKATYSSYEDDIATEFYIPTLKTSKNTIEQRHIFLQRHLQAMQKGWRRLGRRKPL